MPEVLASAEATLSDVDLDMLEFERDWVQPSARKDEQILLRFKVSPIGYYLALAQLLARPEAMAYDPLLVQRLQRQFDRRRRWRTGG